MGDAPMAGASTTSRLACMDDVGFAQLRATLARTHDAHEPAPGDQGEAAWAPLCPICTCFTIEDEVQEDGGVRRRLLDSRLLEGFQHEASAHNPSPRPGDRERRFWTHELGASFTRRMERPGCVGCGRCDVTCPGSIGARAVLGRLGASS